MRISKPVLVVSFGLALSACGGGGGGSPTTTSSDALEEIRDDAVAVIGQVCESPIYAALLGYHEGEFSDQTVSGTRSCRWNVAMQFNGTNMDIRCIVTGTVKSTVTFQEPNDVSPYTCATLDEEFSITGSVAPLNLATFMPQDFAMSFPVGTLQPDNTVVTPVSNGEIFSIDNNLMLQFEIGTLNRVGDSAP